MGVYSPIEREFFDAAREFASGAIRPHVGEWDREGRLPESLFGELAELGFWGLRVPEAQGGLGLTLSEYVAALEGLAWGDPAVSMMVAIHNGPALEVLLRNGTPEQLGEWLPGVAAGEPRLGFALAEEEAGTDPSLLQTRAERSGAGWSLSGRKAWVTGAPRAGATVVVARAEGVDPGAVAFLVPSESEGRTVQDRDETMGFLAAEVSAVRFDGVSVPDSHRLGELGDVEGHLGEVAAVARLGVAAQAVGIGQAALEHARAYARERSQFERSLSEFGAIRDKLGRMVARVAAARALVLSVARAEGGPEGGIDGLSFAAGTAVAKVVASEAAVFVADEAVQIFGGYGYMRHYPVEKLLRDAQGTEIFEGTTEAMRGLTAEDCLSQF
jgi:alkylation response protein AidB-like acyl-CoA dehydrogenase